MVQWFRLQASDAEGTGLIPDWGTNVPHATWNSQKKKKKAEECSFFSGWSLAQLKFEIFITKEEGEIRELEGSMGLCHNNNN